MWLLSLYNRLVIEYKGFFSTINRLENGQYIGVVTGLQSCPIKIQATSICQLRKRFETVVDEFLMQASPGRAVGAEIEAQAFRNN